MGMELRDRQAGHSSGHNIQMLKIRNVYVLFEM